MAAGHIKEVFPGGNTARGFVSFYEYLAFPKRRKIFVLKGGPGVGKSTFMRRIGLELAEQGHDIEFHHCSSDNQSLDGVYVPAAGVALLDGTAPHVVDPKHPGAVDEIVLLGDFWDEPALRLNASSIVAGFLENGRIFRCAYANLAAAKVYADEVETYYRDTKALDMPGLNACARELEWDIFGDITASSPGPDRHLFASAITPDGLLNHIETIAELAGKRYVIKGDMGTGKSTILRKLYDEALSRNFYIEAYHCALTSEHLEHLFVPELDTVVLTSTAAHAIRESECDTVTDTADFVDEEAVSRVAGDLDAARQLYLAAMDRAVGFISRAKVNHDALETLYVPHMDFDRVSGRREEVMERIVALV